MRLTDNIIDFDYAGTFGTLFFVKGTKRQEYDQEQGGYTGEIIEKKIEISSDIQGKNFTVKLPVEVDIDQFKRNDLVTLEDVVIKYYAMIDADAFSNQANEGYSITAQNVKLAFQKKEPLKQKEVVAGVK